MKRRTALTATGIALTFSAGCLGNFGTNERRENACNHVPGDTELLEFESHRFQNQVGLITDGYWDTEHHEEGIQFVLASSSRDVQRKLQLERLDEEGHGRARSFIEETEFSEQALLVWHRAITTGDELEIVGVDHPEEELLRAYTCSYDGTGPDETSATAEEYYNILIRVTVSGTPKRAILTHNRENTTTTYDTEHEQ
jgi:hypothetical protein